MCDDRPYGLTSAAWNMRRSKARRRWPRGLRWPRSLRSGERVVALTHAAGAIVSAGLSSALVFWSLGRTSLACILSTAVFAAALITMYTTWLTHRGSGRAGRKPLLRALACCGLYLLIAATYALFVVGFGNG